MKRDYIRIKDIPELLTIGCLVGLLYIYKHLSKHVTNIGNIIVWRKQIIDRSIK